MSDLHPSHTQILHCGYFSKSQSELAQQSGQHHTDHLVPSPGQSCCIVGPAYCSGWSGGQASCTQKVYVNQLEPPLIRGRLLECCVGKGQYGMCHWVPKCISVRMQTVSNSAKDGEGAGLRENYIVMMGWIIVPRIILWAFKRLRNII